MEIGKKLSFLVAESHIIFVGTMKFYLSQRPGPLTTTVRLPLVSHKTSGIRLEYSADQTTTSSAISFWKDYSTFVYGIKPKDLLHRARREFTSLSDISTVLWNNASPLDRICLGL
jgi:hypothetical protein